MKLKFSFIAVVAVVLSIVLPGALQVSATSASDYQNKINNLEQERKEALNESNNLNSKKSETEAKIAENEEQQQQVLEEIEQISLELENTKTELNNKREEIDQTTNEIDQTNEDIERLEQEIVVLLDRIEKREELLKNRLRALQQSGGNISYLDVLMGAQSFGDFINRATAVIKIMDQDKEIVETHIQEKDELQTKQMDLETKKENLEQKKVDLENQKQELESLQSQLDEQRAEQERLKKQLEHEHAELEEYKLTIEEEARIARNEAAALKKAIQQAKSEKERLEQLSGDGTASNPPRRGGDLFGWPADATYVSSEFNPDRMHPIFNYRRPHTGMDIAKNGTVDIYAAASGVVSSVLYDYPGSGAGNSIYITHYLNGQQYTTTYYHLRDNSITVSEGDTVTRGQKIALMGSTGNSTGQHLHFEIRKGGYTKGYAVNPRPYLFP